MRMMFGSKWNFENYCSSEHFLFHTESKCRLYRLLESSQLTVSQNKLSNFQINMTERNNNNKATLFLSLLDVVLAIVIDVVLYFVLDVFYITVVVMW